MSCGSYRRVKLLEHAMQIVERVLKKKDFEIGRMHWKERVCRSTLDKQK